MFKYSLKRKKMWICVPESLGANQAARGAENVISKNVLQTRTKNGM